jgi:hypothetical protein
MSLFDALRGVWGRQSTFEEQVKHGFYNGASQMDYLQYLRNIARTQTDERNIIPDGVIIEGEVISRD